MKREKQVDFLTGDAYYLRIASAVAAGAKCTRLQVGAIIVDDSGHVVATGKNGSPPGHPECTDGACPRGRHYEAPGGGLKCACGEDWPCVNVMPHGSSYDTGPGACIAVHAEGNCLLNRTVASVAGGVMYVTSEPCGGCRKLIAGARISRVVWPGGVIEWIPGSAG